MTLTAPEKDYFNSNFEIYNQVDAFLDLHKNETESKQNLSTSIASGYVKLLKEENLTDISIDLGDIGNFDDPYWEIAKDLLLESVKELLLDLIPGGTLLPIDPEVLNNIQAGNWMDVMYGVTDIILNEADTLFPAAKIASFSVGIFVTGQQLKKVFTASKRRRLSQKVYNVLRSKLGWSIKEVRGRFKWIDNSIGAKLDKHCVKCIL